MYLDPADPDTDVKCQFLDPKTVIMNKFLDLELDKSHTFLNPETDIMGERNFTEFVVGCVHDHQLCIQT